VVIGPAVLPSLSGRYACPSAAVLKKELLTAKQSRELHGLAIKKTVTEHPKHRISVSSVAHVQSTLRFLRP
jgi:hypothetical protein